MLLEPGDTSSPLFVKETALERLWLARRRLERQLAAPELKDKFVGKPSTAVAGVVERVTVPLLMVVAPV